MTTVPASRGLRSLLESDPVVVTGMGAVCAAGTTVAALWDAVIRGKSMAQWADLPGLSDPCAGFPAAAVDWSAHPWSRMARRLDPGSQLALHAAHQAADQAGVLEMRATSPERVGVILGSSRGSMVKWEEAHELLRDCRRMKPTLAATTTLGAGAGALAQVLGSRGPTWSVSTACASGAFAIASGAEQIALGHADIMVVGGADCALHPTIHAGLQAAGVLARGCGSPSEWCRPFCTDRTGLVPGDGAGMLVLESLSSAERRGAVPLAVLAGWNCGIAPDGLAGMEAEGQGLQRAMRAAMELAGVSPHQIDYINAHGTGTVANDAAEAAALRGVFGSHQPPCSSSKSLTGHCLGGTPALEAILCVHALLEGKTPPAFPALGLDPALRLRFATSSDRKPLRRVLSNSAAFWGFTASLLFSSPLTGRKSVALSPL